jgi:hypothetical protein
MPKVNLTQGELAALGAAVNLALADIDADRKNYHESFLKRLQSASDKLDLFRKFSLDFVVYVDDRTKGK